MAKPVSKVTPETITELSEKLGKAKAEIHKVIFGQDEIVELALCAVISNNHVILEGVPGLAKTKLVSTIGKVMGLDTNRVQCTPELMPADITGSEVLEETGGKKAFRFVNGPVFCQLLMADEINRASPRTQSALLQAMQEKQVSYMGKNYDLPKPFLVFATQNPIEQEGTYPLPEAQLDRFAMKINLSYPDAKTEMDVIIKTTSEKEQQPKAIFTDKEIVALEDIFLEIPVAQSVADAVLEIIRQSRPETSDIKDVTEYVSWGCGPRGGQFMIQIAKARAVLDGRLTPSIEDLAAIAPKVLGHRIGMKFHARSQDVNQATIVEKLVRHVCG